MTDAKEADGSGTIEDLFAAVVELNAKHAATISSLEANQLSEISALKMRYGCKLTAKSEEVTRLEGQLETTKTAAITMVAELKGQLETTMMAAEKTVAKLEGQLQRYELPSVRWFSEAIENAPRAKTTKFNNITVSLGPLPPLPDQKI
jgi:hypothetical protein